MAKRHLPERCGAAGGGRLPQFGGCRVGGHLLEPSHVEPGGWCLNCLRHIAELGRRGEHPQGRPERLQRTWPDWWPRPADAVPEQRVRRRLHLLKRAASGRLTPWPTPSATFWLDRMIHAVIIICLQRII